jgi:formylglycine-generating enzyme required for sulfatase activity
MSFEHERIHIETSSVLISELPLKYVRFPVGHMPPYFPHQKNSPMDPQAGIDYPMNKMIPVEETEITLGKPITTPSFGWDNEYGHRSYQVPAFEASQFKVTNGEFLEFVKDGGYGASQFWSDVGWKWR